MLLWTYKEQFCMIKNNNLILSQSETKELGVFVIDDQVEEIDYCPKRYYHKYIAEDYPREPSRAMLEGLYGETLLLGSSAKGEKIEDLPRKNDGTKRVSQIRIERQMDRLYGYMYAHGIRINPSNTQVRLIAQYRPHIWLKGEFDLFPVLVNNILSIVDVKTTKDIYSDFFSIADKWVRTACNHCWGDYAKIVKNQPLFYHFIARRYKDQPLDFLQRFNPEQSDKLEWLYNTPIDEEEINFWFFVAGIGKADMDGQLAKYEYQWNAQREVLLEALVQESVRRVKDAMNSEFEARPSESLCRSCALKDICKDAKI